VGSRRIRGIKIVKELYWESMRGGVPMERVEKNQDKKVVNAVLVLRLQTTLFTRTDDGQLIQELQDAPVL
jgi:hypothetical protein